MFQIRLCLRGDHSTVARDIASKIGIDQVYSDLLPQDKVTQLEKLMGNDHVVALLVMVLMMHRSC